MTRYLVLLLLLLLLVGCGGRGQSSGDGVAVTDATSSPYQMLNSSSDLAPGRPRLVLTLWDGPQRLTDAKALDVTLLALTEGGESGTALWQGAATPYRMGDLQYWVSYPEIPTEGVYGVLAFVTTNDGQRVENRALIQVKPAPEAPALGQPAPRSQTRTLADAPVEELTSAGPYVERFYQLSVAEAAEAGKPAIIAFVTPGHCTTALCAPVLGSVQTVSEDLGDTVNVVHVEVWRDFAKEQVEPAFNEWHLTTEPWLFILDADGTIAARLDGPVSSDELRTVMQEVIGG